MFGHKDGKIEKELKQVDAALKGLEPFLNDVESGNVNPIKIKSAKASVAIIRNHVQKLIGLSQRIHDIIQEEI